MTKTFTNASNAARAARKALGPAAQRGVDFFITQTDAGFAFEAATAYAAAVELSDDADLVNASAFDAGSDALDAALDGGATLIEASVTAAQAEAAERALFAPISPEAFKAQLLAEEAADALVRVSGAETSEGETGFWTQSDNGPIWTTTAAAEPMTTAQVWDAVDTGEIDMSKAAPTIAEMVTTLLAPAAKGPVSDADAFKAAKAAGKGVVTAGKIAAAKGETKAAKGPSKVDQLVAAAQRPGGITIKAAGELTGWAKFGGFFTAVKKAGLVLNSRKVDGLTTWFVTGAEQAAA